MRLVPAAVLQPRPLCCVLIEFMAVRLARGRSGVVLPITKQLRKVGATTATCAMSSREAGR
jgi:hypothetical protein